MLLQGHKVLNTRARHQAVELTALLENQGAEVVELPMLEIVPSAGNFQELSSVNWVLFTSANGVKFSPDLPLGVKVGVVGEATAKVARERGFDVQFVASVSDAESFAREFVGSLKDRDIKVLVLRGDVANTRLEEVLVEVGVEVEVEVIYQSVAPKLSEELVQEIRNVDFNVLIFTSSQAVRNFVKIFDLETFKNVPVAVIGPKTAEIVEEVGLNLVLVAKKARLESLVGELSKIVKNYRVC